MDYVIHQCQLSYFMFNTRYKHDKPCKHILDGNQCQFNQNNNKCLFSLGNK